ncbi:MAG: intein-containing RctB family protein [candidate division KSB1 bacterium]|nr:intein-containing RctB family protein [candidate division KSB1 bacterium]MDZ7303833.1 intein-containing RctB family protein [candidate division KSB1 bacterium]MDZ7312734.1 intein-containing RctB family protein [candidate division KSB1 bacterium]
MSEIKLNKVTDYLWEIPREGNMLVPARIYATEKMLKDILADNAPQQAANVAHLPGIVGYSLAMPDIHWGYGFPIGGVAAFDVNSGVISPGGVGYDINCLAGDTRVLSAHGYSRTIAEMEIDWQSANLHCQDFNANHDAETKVLGYLKRWPNTPVYRVTTDTGDEIVATADHPFWTPDGMVELRRLQAGDRVARYPFEGVPYESPDDKILVDEADIARVLAVHDKGASGNALAQILNQLKVRQLLPLRANSPQLPYLLKLLGYVFGDGTIYFSGDVGKGTTWFYGEPEDLETMRRDVAAAGFTPSRIYSRERQHRITTTYDEYEFANREHVFKVVSSSFAALLAAIGAPVGNKASQNYGVPTWLFDAPLWQQRLFLAALFGAELSSPRAFDERNYNFMPPVLSLNKRAEYLESGQRFLESISRLLDGFGIHANTISQRQEQTNKDGSVSNRLRLILSSQTESLLNLWGRIGFEYNRKRRVLANVAVAYLKQKANIVQIREEAAEAATALQAEGMAPQEIYDTLVGSHVNRRFLERSLYEGRATSARVGESFMTFDEYRAEATLGLGESGMVWSRIIRLEAIPFSEEVYDFTVAHPDHNFVANGFVVSNCGVRLMASSLTRDEVEPKIQELVKALFHHVPTGVGSEGKVKLSQKELEEVMTKGAQWSVKNGYGDKDDLEFIEENGQIDGADPSKVSKKASERGRPQLGTLGSGNHFLEVGYVAQIFNARAAEALGLFPNQITVIIHCGSRGFGHQVCEDYIGVMNTAVHKYGITLPDRQLCCAPVNSPEGQNYLGAMRCAINFAFANRQMIAHWTREAFARAINKAPKYIGLRTVYEVAHNIAKMEDHVFEGKQMTVCVHRKGATRAFPPGHSQIPEAYQEIGQPVLIPGDMGRYSYVLIGAQEAMEQTFGSTCHGAGRAMSRHKAKKTAHGRNITRELAEKGIYVMGASRGTIDEEISEAYKDVADVVDTCHLAGISRKVAQLRPLGCIKG